MAVSAWSTFAIAYKTFQHWSMRRAQVHIVSRRTELEDVLTVLIETGLVYTVLWIVFFSESVSATPGHFGLAWLEVIMSVAVPIYPMWIMMVMASAKDEPNSAMQLRTLDPVTLAGATVDIGRDEYKEVRTESPRLEGGDV